MAPPTQHPLYPILEVEYDDQHQAHILSDDDAEVSLPPLRPVDAGPMGYPAWKREDLV